jgi:nitrate reductase NapE component
MFVYVPFNVSSHIGSVVERFNRLYTITQILDLLKCSFMGSIGILVELFQQLAAPPERQGC